MLNILQCIGRWSSRTKNDLAPNFTSVKVKKLCFNWWDQLFYSLPWGMDKVNRETKHVSSNPSHSNTNHPKVYFTFKSEEWKPKLQLEHSLLTVNIARPSMSSFPGLPDLGSQPKERVRENCACQQANLSLN